MRDQPSNQAGEKNKKMPKCLGINAIRTIQIIFHFFANFRPLVTFGGNVLTNDSTPHPVENNIFSFQKYEDIESEIWHIVCF